MNKMNIDDDVMEHFEYPATLGKAAAAADAIPGRAGGCRRCELSTAAPISDCHCGKQTPLQT